MTDWPRVRLGEVLSLEYGKSLPARTRDPLGEFPVAGSNGPDGKHTTALVSSPGIVVGRKGSAGRVYWYDNDFWPIDTTYYVVPRMSLEIRWAYYLLSRLRLDRFATTTGVPGLNRNDTYGLEISLPPRSEQRRIVEILDQANRLRSLRAAGDAKAERLCRVLFMRMFGNPATFWRIGRLGDLLRRRQGALQSGPFGTDLHTSDFVPSGKILAVGIDNVLDGEFVLGRNRRITLEKYQELTKYTLDPGDVLITIMGTVGRTCVFPGTPSPAICTKHVYRMQLDESVHPEYLSATLRFSEAARAQIGAGITGQTVSGIKSKDLRRLQLSIPPAELQAEFAAGKEKIDAIQQRARSARKACEALFSLLAHRAFRAELTASWREAHMKELLQEMEQQARTSSQEVPRP